MKSKRKRNGKGPGSARCLACEQDFLSKQELLSHINLCHPRVNIGKKWLTAVGLKRCLRCRKIDLEEHSDCTATQIQEAVENGEVVEVVRYYDKQPATIFGGKRLSPIHPSVESEVEFMWEEEQKTRGQDPELLPPPATKEEGQGEEEIAPPPASKEEEQDEDEASDDPTTPSPPKKERKVRACIPPPGGTLLETLRDNLPIRKPDTPLMMSGTVETPEMTSKGAWRLAETREPEKEEESLDHSVEQEGKCCSYHWKKLGFTRFDGQEFPLGAQEGRRTYPDVDALVELGNLTEGGSPLPLAGILGAMELENATGGKEGMEWETSPPSSPIPALPIARKKTLESQEQPLN